MLLMHKRSSMGMLAIVCSDPANSTQWFKTSSDPNREQRLRITSFPVTPGGSRPVKVILATGGCCSHVLPVAHMAAASVRTTGVPRHPMPP